MTRRRYGWTDEKIARRIKEGRGKGAGAAYKPWLTIRDVPSRGRSHRIPCPKIGREGHLLSDGEAGAFRLAWFDDMVVDIREQFPLPRIETLRIAQSLGIRHPVDRYSRCVLVQTTDLLVTIKNGRGTRYEAWSAKEADELKSGRVLDKLELERRYWTEKAVGWRLLTEQRTKTVFTANLTWILDGHLPVPPLLRERGAICEFMLARMIREAPSASLHETCLAFDLREGLERGTGLELARWMLAEKRLVTDLSRPHPQDAPGCAFTFVTRAQVGSFA